MNSSIKVPKLNQKCAPISGTKVQRPPKSQLRKCLSRTLNGHLHFSRHHVVLLPTDVVHAYTPTNQGAAPFCDLIPIPAVCENGLTVRVCKVFSFIDLCVMNVCYVFSEANDDLAIAFVPECVGSNPGKRGRHRQSFIGMFSKSLHRTIHQSS